MEGNKSIKRILQTPNKKRYYENQTVKKSKSIKEEFGEMCEKRQPSHVLRDAG